MDRPPDGRNRERRRGRVRGWQFVSSYEGGAFDDSHQALSGYGTKGIVGRGFSGWRGEVEGWTDAVRHELRDDRATYIQSGWRDALAGAFGNDGQLGTGARDELRLCARGGAYSASSRARVLFC